MCLLHGTDWIFIYIILRSAHTVYLCVLCGSENKQQLFPYTALTDRLLLLLLLLLLLVVVVVVVLVLVTAIELSGGSSPYTSTNKTNKNKQT